MAKEIKQKIVLSGEKEYNQALKDAQRNLKTLQSALKAETAELGKNASEEDKARVKTASLTQQIAEQEKVVATLASALDEVKEKYGDNETEIARWEQKLNNARATLAGMKNDLESTGEGFQAAEKGAAQAIVATKSFADSLKDLGGVGDGVADAIEGIFSGVIDRVADAVGELWGLISATAAKANNWTDIANMWGTDPQKIQEYNNALRAQGKNFEDLQALVSKIVLGGKGKKITELLGISDIGYKSDWQYAMDVMDMMYAKARSGQDMNPIYEEIFGGKQGTKVIDLINTWGEISQDIATGAWNGNTSGYGMSDEELQTMNDLWIKISDIETKWNALKDNFAAGFGVAAMNLSVNVEGALDGLAEYMSAENEGEKQQALEKIRENIEEFFRRVAELIREGVETLRGVGEERQNSDDPLTKMIGDIFVKLSNALQWFIDNADAVKAAFNTIFGVWLIAKLTAVAGQLTGILANIKTIQAFSALGGAAGVAGAAAKGAVGGAAGAGAGGAAAAGAGIGAAVTKVLTSGVTKAAGGAGAFVGTLFGDLFRPADPHRGEASEIEINTGGGAIVLAGELTPAEKALADWKKEAEAGRGTDFTGTGELIYKGRSPKADQHELVEEIVEEILDDGVDEFTEAQKEALEDLFDVWRNRENGEEGDDEFDRAWDHAQEVLGDAFGEAYEHMVEEMDKNPNWLKENDIPLSWWQGAMNPANWNGGSNGAMNQNGITSTDLASFQKLPAGMQRAVEAGAKAGVSGIQVQLDGRAVGSLVAPYVSEYIATDIFAYEQ